MSIGMLYQIRADMKSGVYDFTQGGECSSCGNCCSDYLPMSEKECKRILDYVQRKHIKECIHRPPTAEPVMDMACPFRDDEKRICTIYEVRPAICRDFRCDKPRRQIEADKKMYQGKYGIVFVRETFFPKDR